LLPDSRDVATCYKFVSVATRSNLSWLAPRRANLIGLVGQLIKNMIKNRITQ
jgi:hypothetical protein